MAYFLASVPGIVHLVLFMANGDKNGSGISGVGNGFYRRLCCLWRIYLLERWLEHPFWSAMEALYAGRKQLVTTGAVSIFFWYLGAHLLYFTEFDNPDAKIREFYGSVARAIWACSIYLNGEWVFCDFSWAGKAVGGFIVLFGVSIVVVPMSVFTFNFLTNIQGDFYETKVWHLKAEPADLWQLKLMPKDDAPVWRKQLFRLLYEHLQKLEKCLKAKDKGQDSPKWELSQGFLLFKWVSITASVVFVLITIMENSEYMNTDNCVESSARNPLFHGPDEIQRCKDFFSRLDHVEYSVDLVFLHFFILEFIMRCVCLRWRHLISELGLAEMLSITGLVASLTDYREVALHHPEQHKEWTYKLAIGSVVSLRLCRLVCVGSYFGLLRALRKVVAVSQWSLLKSFYFLVAVWFTHAMLLHFTEFQNHTQALAGAQVLPSIEAQFVRHQQGYATLVEELQKHSFLQISGFASNASASNLSLVNVTNVANVTNVTNVTNSTSSEVPRHPYQVIPTPMNQSTRFGDYLGAMQYSLQHLAGDYPMVEYTGAGKLVLMLGLVIGTCAITAWTAVFSSAMVNYLANEAEEDDYLAKAASHRMLVAIEVVMRLQQQWRRRKRRREAAIARGEPPVNDLERQALGFRTKVRRLLFRQGALGKALIFVFQVTLVVNIVANLLHSLPEFRENKQVEPVRWRVEAVCDLIFLVELILYLIAGKGRQGVRWVFGRTVDMVCLVPGLVALWHMVNRIKKLEDLDMELLGSSEVFKSNDTTDFQMLLDTLQMIRVVRILFWHQWQRKVHVVLSGIAQTGPILVIPAIMSSLIWIMTSALFVWMENVYDGPSKDFFTSVPTSMYWTSSFLIGEWTLADFSSGGGNRVCIAICLFGTMGFAIPMGLMMEGVQQAITLDHFESTPLQELDAISMADEAVKEKRRASRVLQLRPTSRRPGSPTGAWARTSTSS
ncbi:unnamed protein product [Effrenium voratum]|nr:unnamed protein product [Effrenium voratum]